MRSVISFTALLVLATMSAFTNPQSLSVSSSAFSSGGMMPSKYSCEGAQVSPPLTIGGIPPSAKSLALIVHDPDAPMRGGFTHWVMWNLPISSNIPEGYKGSDQGYNSMQKTGWTGMCPPSGTHHYHFMVYALDTKLSISKTATEANLEKAMAGHILAQGELVGLYKKSK